MLYTTDITRILRSNSVTAKVYNGCYASNKIPKCGKYPCAMVVNFDDASEPGTHWAALYARSPVHVFYFDSLGLGVDEVKDIKDYVWANFLTSTQQHLGLQRRGSTACGYYVLFFIYACAKQIPFAKIEALLSSQPNPDRFVYNFVNSNISNKKV